MLFETLGSKSNPAVIFFHAMGVVGKSSVPVASFLSSKYYCIMPTATVYCKGQRYLGKGDEVRQVKEFLKAQGIASLELVVASSIGADLALAFLSDLETGSKPDSDAEPANCLKNVFFDGGQFAQIGKGTRMFMVPLLYLAMKSLYWSKGGTLGKIMWCDDDSIKSYFIEAGKNLRYGNLHRMMMDSLENVAFPALPAKLQKRMFFEFGSKEEHFKYRPAVMEAYPNANFPVFEGYNHMQYQIRDSEGFASMLASIMECGSLPQLPFMDM